MHEMGMANSILEAVTRELSRYPGARGTKVGVRIGELAAIDPESLRFCFDALARDTSLEGLELETEFCPRRQRCDVCSIEFDVHDYEFCCPRCATSETKFVSGDELELTYLEVEEYEPTGNGTEGS